MLTPISNHSEFVLQLEKFIAKAEAFLQNHYQEATGVEEIEAICKAVENLWMDTDKKALLEEEYHLHCDRKDLEADAYDSAWF